MFDMGLNVLFKITKNPGILLPLKVKPLANYDGQQYCLCAEALELSH